MSELAEGQILHRMDRPNCVNCDHPGIHHDEDGCWTNAAGFEVWGDEPDVCVCPWYEAAR